MAIGSCRLCGLDQLLPLFTIADNEGHPTEIRICLRCFVLVPEYDRGAVPAEQMTEHQAKYHDAQWAETSREEAETLRRELADLLVFYRDLLGPPKAGEITFDIGAGRGALVAALRDAGYDGRGCEPSPALADRARKAYSLTEEQLVTSSAEDLLDRIQREKIPVGHFFLWHVIEHVADPLGLMRRLASVLPEGHCIFVQAPCLKEPWLYPEHLVLFTEPAVFAVARNCGCELVTINYDHKLAFVTFVLRRTAEPLSGAWIPIPSFAPSPLAALEVEVPRLRKALEESRAHAQVMVAMADERARGIEAQTQIINDRDKWIADLQERAGRTKAEIDRLTFDLGQARERIAFLERIEAEIRRENAAVHERLQAHEKRIVSERVEKMLSRVWPGTRR